MPTCSNCGTTVSAAAEQCPDCGAVFADAAADDGRDWNLTRGLAVGLVAAVLFLAAAPIVGITLELVVVLAVPAGVLAGVFSAVV